MYSSITRGIRSVPGLPPICWTGGANTRFGNGPPLGFSGPAVVRKPRFLHHHPSRIPPPFSWVACLVPSRLCPAAPPSDVCRTFCTGSSSSLTLESHPPGDQPLTLTRIRPSLRFGMSAPTGQKEWPFILPLQTSLSTMSSASNPLQTGTQSVTAKYEGTFRFFSRFLIQDSIPGPSCFGIASVKGRLVYQTLDELRTLACR